MSPRALLIIIFIIIIIRLRFDARSTFVRHAFDCLSEVINNLSAQWRNPLSAVAEGALSDDARLMSVCLCLTSVAYIGPKSRTERPRETKIGPRHT